MSVLYPAEICLHDLELGEKNDHVNGDFSRPIYHCGEPLVVQLSSCIDLFGVLDYHNPSGQAQSVKYSTGICLSSSNPVIKNFVRILESLESMVEDEFKQDGWEFVSTIKVNRKGEKHLRVKLPFKYNAMQFEIYNNKQKTWMDINKLKRELTHGRTIDVILQLNPVWNSGKKYGISWKLCAIDFQSKQFRRTFPQEYVKEEPKPRRRGRRKGKRKRRKTPPPIGSLSPQRGTPESQIEKEATPPPGAPPPSPAKEE